MRAFAFEYVAAALCLAAPEANAAPAFTFALIGDLGYSETNTPVEHEKQMAVLLDELNATQLAFVVHDGDLGHPREMCADEGLLRRLAQFQASVHPLIYTPGDNEWMDCGAERLARLERVRELFFPGEESLGRKKLPLLRQSAGAPALAKFRENVRWQFGEVTFLTIHMVGSGNNAFSPEHTERDAANLEWIRASFAAAKAAGSRALILITQANVFPRGPLAGGYTRAFFNRLGDEVVAFGKPVVLVHGDSHQFIVDKPLTDTNGRALENFTRVQTFGTPDHHWVQAFVDYDDPNVFQFQQRLIKANLFNRPAP